MTRLTWDDAGDKLYEIGLDKAVLYIDGVGTAWNGLVSIAESGYESKESLIFDGHKILDLQSPSSYSAVLKAITYPKEFYICTGNVQNVLGVVYPNQEKYPFCLSYRTLTGDDVNGLSGYKIHILYNLTASPNPIVQETLGNTADVTLFSWDIKSYPSLISPNAQTGHVVIDSRYIAPDLLADLEDGLYGTVSTDSTLPEVSTLIDSVIAWADIVITDNEDGTWTAEGSSAYITLLDSTTFQITSVNAVYIDSNTYDVTSTSV